MRLLLIGFGNLGRGLARSILEGGKFKDLKVVGIVDERGGVLNDEGIELRQALEVAESEGSVAKMGIEGLSAVEAIRESDADLVVELTPTNIKTGEPGLTHIRTALETGKHVVTSNKGPLVIAFRELQKLASSKGVQFKYSATVGGAIPVISLARRLASGDEILGVRGVLNGTTNYILTRMEREGLSQDVVIREAQELGIAEKDPTLDIEGIDTACKLVILANSILDMDVKLSDVKITGISRISPEALKLAREAGYTIKLIGNADKKGLDVRPRLVPLDHPLNIGGTLNAVSFRLRYAREITISGFGAGPAETSSALLADIMEVLASSPAS